MSSPSVPYSDEPPTEVTKAYFEAITAALQVLVLTLQSNGSLKQGEYQVALRVYMEGFTAQAQLRDHIGAS